MEKRLLRVSKEDIARHERFLVFDREQPGIYDLNRAELFIPETPSAVVGYPGIQVGRAFIDKLIEMSHLVPEGWGPYVVGTATTLYLREGRGGVYLPAMARREYPEGVKWEWTGMPLFQENTIRFQALRFPKEAVTVI